MSTKNIATIVCFAILLLAGVYFMPWHKITWGKVEMIPASTITVVGEARGIEKNQIASFTAGVSANGTDKQTTIDEVNQKTTELIEAVKNFGIAEEDIKTQNISVNEQKNPIEISPTGGYQWHVNNSIVITLRDVDRASELTAVLSNTGANNIYGPNFRVDQEQTNNDDLVVQAVENAREKAEKIAQASQGELGKVISVSETEQSGSFGFVSKTLEFAGADGAPLEPGTSTSYKSVVVVFELE